METCSPSEKTTALSSTVICVRRVNAVLVVAVAAVAAAALSAFLRSAIYILEQQTFTTKYQRAGESPWGVFEMMETLPTASNRSESVAERDEQGHLNLVFVLDFWERMVNIQSGLRRLVNIGVESGFTVVEPFMYESRIRPAYSDPYHFETQNMTPQPARRYFQTEDLFFTNSYISYEEGMRRIERVQKSEEDAPKTYIIQAAVFFDWSDQTSEREREEAKLSSSMFRWCDEKLNSMVASDLGYMISKATFIERAVCVSVRRTMSPSVLTPRHFHDLFSFIRKGTSNTNRKCMKCTALAFMNYRKHAFNGFRSSLGIQPFKQKVPPLEVSAFGKELGKRVRTEVLENRPYVAIQIRTGKAFSLLQKYERRLSKEGVTFTRYASFKTWLQRCTRKICSAAKKERRELGRRAVYYIASDMFNEGWKGGERCPEEVKKAMDEAKRYIFEELYPVYRFDPKLFGVRQDIMGSSSIADAAVSREADRFLYAKPSNFGRWVAEQREVAGKGEVVRINCMDERLHDI